MTIRLRLQDKRVLDTLGKLQNNRTARGSKANVGVGTRTNYKNIQKGNNKGKIATQQAEESPKQNNPHEHSPDQHLTITQWRAA